MVQSISIHEFYDLTDPIKIIDVRSEGEFLAGHIPSAINIPILNDEERKIVGTVFKNNGSQTAVLKGLELTGPHLNSRLKQGLKVAEKQQVLIHCWRGGMRSEFFSFLFHYYGLQPLLLTGGYKAFRTMAHETFSSPFRIKVLSGKTGSGKTYLLKELSDLGEQTIDLEGLAHHRGSSFGAIGMPPQPSQEQFENNLFEIIRNLDPLRTVWIEDESRTIGSKVIPEGLWNQMVNAEHVLVDKSFDERLNQIMLDYGGFDKEALIPAMQRIGKRLGPQHVKVAIEQLENGNVLEAFRMALVYYDKAYTFLLEKHAIELSSIIEIHGLSHLDAAKKILNKINRNGR